ELNGAHNDGTPHGHGPTNPAQADTDGDGCLDGAELSKGLNPNNSGDCSSTDGDTDGLSDDLEALLGSDPNNPDTDADGLTDGAEYYGTNNEGVSHGHGPTSPLKPDTDADGLSDHAEIYTHGTNPNQADTDGDGLNDGQEIRLGTDPKKKDTDGDTCEDGFEIQYGIQYGLDPLNKNDCPPPRVDRDCDGLTDAEEAQLGTNINNRDSDGDGLRDGYEMGVSFNPDPFNCPEADFLSDVHNPSGYTSNPKEKDTDDDGLDDYRERQLNTDPNNPDTDGDGLNDGAEVDGTDNDGKPHGFGATNPSKPDTDNGSVPDGAEVIGGLNPNSAGDDTGVVRDACGNPRSFSEKGVKDADLSLAFPSTFSTVNTLTVSGKERGIMIYDPTNKVVGFALELPNSPGITAATIAAQEQLGRTIVASTSAITSAMAQNFTSWDGYPSAIGYYEQAGSGNATQRATNIVKGFLGNSVQGTLGSNSGSGTGNFKLQLQYLHRKDASQNYRTIVVGALTTSTSDAALIELSDLAGGTALAQFGDKHPLACERVTITGDSKVDFIWVVDFSYSMEQWTAAVSAAADAMATQLNQAAIDWRVAVIYHDTDRATTRKHQPHGFTTNITDFKNWVNVQANGDNPERMFSPVKQMLEHENTRWLPSMASANANRLRTGAKVVVIWLSDAKEQTINGVCDSGPGYSCYNTVDRNNPARSLPQGYATWADYFANLPGGMGKAFVAGIVPPVGIRLNAEEVVTSEYRDVITALGGIEMDIQNTNSFQQGIAQIMTAAIGSATSTKLKKPPIAASLKVAATKTMGTCNLADMPRSRTHGFDFDGTAQTLTFYGNCRPDNTAQVAVSYRYWEDLTGPNPTYRDPITCQAPLVPNALGTACVCSDCGGCDAGLACNRSTCQCACPADCNGGCNGNLACDPDSCSCKCELNVSCGQGRVWDGSNDVCDCVCAGDSSNCGPGQVFSQASCSCECATVCGPNEILDPTTCTCGCPNQGEACPIGQTFDEATCSCKCDMSQIDCSQLSPLYDPDPNRCGCSCQDDCGGTCRTDEYCHPGKCECLPYGFN
ncbi:MAG: hypothetical protein LBM75_06240, partial [Myxococcales bacterium]|nr:hypothetical protein [Myxococcales bacterium]